MTKRDKAFARIKALDKNLRFDELSRALEWCGYVGTFPGGGSSHCTFRKEGCPPITVPTHEPIPKVYVDLVKDAIEKAESERKKEVEE